MEFNEKLQELRKARGMTQEELAEALYVSRTAVSKWESGRGYPSIDSLKEISRFFSVTIDELICPEEIIFAAEKEKQSFVGKYLSFICSTLDLLPVLLIFLPLFGNGPGSHEAVSLFAITGISRWIRTVFIVTVCTTILNGISGMVISQFDRPEWNRHRLVTGVALSVLGSGLFMVTRQPNAGIICFTILVVKGLLIMKAK